MNTIENRILTEVNAPQREAILHEEGPLLVVAGAGSGKTRVITRRIAWLINQGHQASSILAITFTNKAAGEMRRRVEEMVGEGRVFISTFHAMCARLLRMSGSSIGISQNFTICDSADQRSLVKEILKNQNLDTTHYRPASVISAISLMKNKMIGPADAAANAASYFDRAVSGVYEAYDEHLRTNELVDFDDLLLKTLQMFQSRQEVREQYQRRFRFVLIDEYQDTNHVQYLLARNLVGVAGNLCATGDPDQSIYGWRGADIKNIIDFENDFPGARVIKLEQNYRSTGNIIKAASSVIANNVMRKERDLWTEAPDGDRIRIDGAESESEEADRIVQMIRKLHGQGTPYAEMAIFYRINALSRPLERSMRIFNIPYTIVGGVEFYQRKEIKDVLAYMKLVHNPRDAISLYRTLNTPPRGIGLTTIKRLKKDSFSQKHTPIDVLRSYSEEGSLSARPLKAIRAFLALLDELRSATGSELVHFVQKIIDDVKYVDYLKNFNDGSANERLENVSELINAVEEYARFNSEPTLGGYLEETALIQDIDSLQDESDSITMMTLHSAKGLEYNAVFVVGVEEGLIPHSRSLDSEEGEEEERRLMYVGITRSRQKLFLSHSMYRSRFGETTRSLPSRFLNEIPQDVVSRTVTRRSGAVTPRPAWQRPPDRPHRPDPIGFTEDKGAVLEYDGDVVPVFVRGDKVEHSYFGQGVVTNVSGSGLSARVKVRFARVGEKLLLVERAGLKKRL
jgi:DNA helicase II / ATP-dependent DNA helicase PcrA